jgi:hypothetical protein
MILAEQVAASLVGRGGHRMYDVDLADVLRRLPRLRVVTAVIGASGYLVPEGAVDGHAYVVLNSSQPTHRQRFTLAHEIGHYLYEKERIVEIDEELWCDQFASYLLIPTERVRAFEANTNRLSEWLAGPASFRVSREAFFRRTWEICYVSFFETTDGHVRVGRPAIVDDRVIEAISSIDRPEPKQQFDIGRTKIQFAASDDFDRWQGLPRRQGVLRTIRGRQSVPRIQSKVVTHVA